MSNFKFPGSEAPPRNPKDVIRSLFPGQATSKAPLVQLFVEQPRPEPARQAPPLAPAPIHGSVSMFSEERPLIESFRQQFIVEQEPPQPELRAARQAPPLAAAPILGSMPFIPAPPVVEAAVAPTPPKKKTAKTAKKKPKKAKKNEQV